MFIGVFKIELFIPASNSLKHKRQVVQSLKDRIKNNFNLAIAEEAVDKWQRARLYMVGINGKRPHLEKTFASIESLFHNCRDIEIIESEREFL